MSNKFVVLAAFLCASGVMGVGCNPFASVQERINQKIGETVAEKIIEAGSGGKIDVDAQDGSFSFKDKETGESVSLGMGAKIPAGFPTDIPRYEGATPSVASLSKDGKRAVLAVTVINVEANVLAEWYDREIQAKGYERKTTTAVTESLFNEYQKGDTKMIMAIIGQKTDDGGYAASVQITRDESVE
jgi:hypothetical protein